MVGGRKGMRGREMVGGSERLREGCGESWMMG